MCADIASVGAVVGGDKALRISRRMASAMPQPREEEAARARMACEATGSVLKKMKQEKKMMMRVAKKAYINPNPKAILRSVQIRLEARAR